MKLIFKLHPAKQNGRSAIDIILSRPKSGSRLWSGKNRKNDKIIVQDTDNLLSALDKLLKRNKIEIRSLKDIKLEIDKKAGLTSQRIIKTIIKALCLNLS